MSRAVQTRTALPGTRPAGAQDESVASRQVRQMFSGIAPRYDLLNHLLSMRFDVMWRNRVARRFRAQLAQPGARALDLCCGTGDLALALARESSRVGGARNAAHGAQVFGADFAEPMLVLARQKSERVQFLEADALAVPFPAETFDLVTVAFGFRNLANYAAGLVELRRLLRPGGSVAILEFTEPESALFGRLYQFYFHRVLPRIGRMISGDNQAYGYLPNSVARFPRPAELATMMRETGFSDVQFQRWTGGIVALHTARR